MLAGWGTQLLLIYTPGYEALFYTMQFNEMHNYGFAAWVVQITQGMSQQ